MIRPIVQLRLVILAGNSNRLIVALSEYEGSKWTLIKGVTAFIDGKKTRITIDIDPQVHL
jgi:hypothetical protein